MTKTETERLTRMEDNQIDFAEALQKINARLDSQDKTLNAINKTLNEISGGRKALMWASGTLFTVIGLILAIAHELKK
jgi:hypothetical protein